MYFFSKCEINNANNTIFKISNPATKVEEKQKIIKSFPLLPAKPSNKEIDNLKKYSLL